MSDEFMPDPKPLTCRELVALVTDYLEGALDDDARLRFETHLNACSGCHNYLDQMRQTIRLSGRLTEEAVQPSALDALLRIFRDWKQS